MLTEADQIFLALWEKCQKEGAPETIDCVIIGGYLSKLGAKRDDKYNEFLVACYDDKNKKFQTICKVAAGFNPKVLNWINKSLKQNIISSPPPEYRFDPSHEPDQWFKPTRVLKIICTTLTLSPVWKAAVGLVDREKGICVHLPCFVWSYNDKKPEEATTASQVADMYHRFQCQAISESDEEDVDII